MANETIKQGLGGASYDPSQVFNPSKKPQAIAQPPKVGLDVSPNAGISTIAGAGYYAGRPVPSSNPMAIAGMEASKPKAIAGGNPALAAIKARDAAITNTPTIPTIAGITPDMVQRPAVARTNQEPPPPAAPAIAGDIKKTVGNFGETKFSDGSGGFAMNEQNRLAEVARQNADSAKIAGQEADNNLLKTANDIDPIFGMAAAASIAKNNVQKYTADAGLASHKLTSDATVKAAQIGGDAAVLKAQQTTQTKQLEQNQKQYTERVKGLVSSWEKLNIPTNIVPKLNYYAQLHAQAEDPNGNVFILAPNRQGGQYAALPKAYEAHYQKLMKEGMSHNDAAARIYNVAQQKGHAIDVPDFNRFQSKHAAEKTY